MSRASLALLAVIVILFINVTEQQKVAIGNQKSLVEKHPGVKSKRMLNILNGIRSKNEQNKNMKRDLQGVKSSSSSRSRPSHSSSSFSRPSHSSSSFSRYSKPSYSSGSTSTIRLIPSTRTRHRQHPSTSFHQSTGTTGHIGGHMYMSSSLYVIGISYLLVYLLI